MFSSFGHKRSTEYVFEADMTHINVDTSMFASFEQCGVKEIEWPLIMRPSLCTD